MSGYIYEEESGEFLIGANLIVEELKKGVSSNNYGFYSLTLDEGEYTIICSFIGYDDFSKRISLRNNLKLKFG